MLNPDQFDVHYVGHDPKHELHRVEAKTDGRSVGFLEWNSAPIFRGAVSHIEVEPEYQRRGIATSMWHAAQRTGVPIRHASGRTESGESWVRSLE